MTENEILNDLECCKRQECDRCSYGKKYGCRIKLLYSAINLIKLQKKGRDEVEEALERSLKEAAELKNMVKIKYTESDMVDQVNGILKIVAEVDEEGEYDLPGLIYRVRQVQKLLSGKWLIVIGENDGLKLIEK